MDKVRKTAKGIIVNRYSNQEGTLHACYYKDGNYPTFPANPKEMINDVTDAEMLWWHELDNHVADRVYNWID
jgi:hypothetical protein